MMTTLNIILQLAESALYSDNSEIEHRGFFKCIRYSAKLLSHKVNNMMDYSLISNRQFKVRRRPV